MLLLFIIIIIIKDIYIAQVAAQLRNGAANALLWQVLAKCKS